MVGVESWRGGKVGMLGGGRVVLVVNGNWVQDAKDA